MENASKALIIAGAVLISILIIGLAVFLYNQAAGTVNRANLNSQEAQAHNQQFEAYFGDKVSASDVKQLMSLVRTNNITSATASETKTIYVRFGASLETAKYEDPASVSTSVKPGKTYNVGVTDSKTTKASEDETENTEGTSPKYDGSYYKSGYIRIITITENQNKSNSSD